MNDAQAVERVTTGQALGAQPAKFRREPSASASVLVALCLMGVFIGVVIFTSYADRTTKSPPRTSARNMPMVHLR